MRWISKSELKDHVKKMYIFEQIMIIIIKPHYS